MAQWPPWQGTTNSENWKRGLWMLFFQLFWLKESVSWDWEEVEINFEEILPFFWIGPGLVFPPSIIRACLHLLLCACLDFCTKLPTTTKQPCPAFNRKTLCNSGKIYWSPKCDIILCVHVLKIQCRRSVSCWSECEEPPLMKVSSLSSLRGISPSDAPPPPPPQAAQLWSARAFWEALLPNMSDHFWAPQHLRAEAKASTFRAPSYLARQGGICCWLWRKNAARKGDGFRLTHIRPPSPSPHTHTQSQPSF